MLLFYFFTAPDEIQNIEGLFTSLNEFWAAEFADLLLSRDQVSVGEPLIRGKVKNSCFTLPPPTAKYKNFMFNVTLTFRQYVRFIHLQG